MNDAEKVLRDHLDENGDTKEFAALDSIFTELAESKTQRDQANLMREGWQEQYVLERESAQARITELEAESRRLSDTLFNLEQQGRARIQTLEAAVTKVSTAGHPEWCSFSCFGGVEEKTCDCWVVPVRQALAEDEA